MWRELKALYGQAAQFARAHPWLLLVPVTLELVQHVVEWRIGMFDGMAQAKAVGADPWRMGFGTVKVVGLILCGYWMPRFLAGRGYLGAERAVPAPSIPASYWPMLGLQVTLTMVGLWVPVALESAGVQSTGALLATFFVVQTVLALLWSGWTATAPVGRDVLSPGASSRLMARRLPWAFAFWLLASLPPMTLHYALNYLAFGKAAALAWALILVDGLVVGFLAFIVAGIPVFQIRRGFTRT